MSVVVLGEAILAAVPRGVVPYVHEGQVASDVESPPWVIANLRLPQIRQRSVAATPQVTSAHLLLTVAAGTARGVLMIVEDLMALDGHRLDVPGWECGPVLVHNVRQPEVDRSLTLTGAIGHVVFAAIEARLTVSAIPTPVPAP